MTYAKLEDIQFKWKQANEFSVLFVVSKAVTSATERI